MIGPCLFCFQRRESLKLLVQTFNFAARPFLLYPGTFLDAPTRSPLPPFKRLRFFFFMFPGEDSSSF